MSRHFSLTVKIYVALGTVTLESMVKLAAVHSKKKCWIAKGFVVLNKTILTGDEWKRISGFQF